MNYFRGVLKFKFILGKNNKNLNSKIRDSPRRKKIISKTKKLMKGF